MNKKEQIIHDLLSQFPELVISDKFSGHVIEIDYENNNVYTRLTDLKEQEYECELNLHYFPQEDLSDNIAFYLVIGEINKKTFVHINYFYWTPEEIEESQKRAKELSDFFLKDDN